MHTSTSGIVDATFTCVEEFQARASKAFVPLRITPASPAGGSDARTARTAAGRRNGDGFRAHFRGIQVNDLIVTRIGCTPTVVRRDDASAPACDSPRMLKVALQQRGHGVVVQGGRESEVAPGDLVAYETGIPYRLRFQEPYDTVVIGIPWPALGAHADLLGDRTARAVPASEGVRPLVATLLTGLSDLSTDLDTAPAPATLHLADALVSLVVSTFAGVTPHDSGTGGDIADQILAHCHANLADPGLSLVSVARAHGVSVSYVQKRLRARGIALGSWIRRQRLHRIRRDLRDPALAQRGTAAIAARWGIMDAAHLGRAMRAEYGATPSEIREAAGLA
ncbi:AraC-like DNA-binding protein [Lipingzhangella halophila]|uniref:AraC-like DNA-binding protein n=1 Tax=Lipingzhangella halophila TaxID=1783352 RepID=A0A7W7W3P9_9ACTN|nr:helix-turn-helix domain-containing protein [Lipingzhangella halophila]MBB4933016.1 AraC-like DNA-binding protein [Lipingzhangella halophila]